VSVWARPLLCTMRTRRALEMPAVSQAAICVAFTGAAKAGRTEPAAAKLTKTTSQHLSFTGNSPNFDLQTLVCKLWFALLDAWFEATGTIDTSNIERRRGYG
jgi:hypothetical protein